ncbi:hypothetical protein ACFQH7_25245, partial [Microbulbifer taiwanensis]
AIDGCKMRSDASKEHSGTFKELEQKRGKIKKKIRQCLKEHKGLDGRKPKEREEAAARPGFGNPQEAL